MIEPPPPVALPDRCPKAPGLFDRSVALEQTLALVPELRRRFGITRIADTTFLDRTGMPTFSAIVPESLDLLSVYNGKGFTRDAALVSAVMEATERQLGADPPELPVFQEHLRTVQQYLDIDAMGLKPEMRDAVAECTFGTDLLTGALIPVPMAMVKCPWYGPSLFSVTSTNGLASGNTLTEALYHALCELVERHVWSIYHAKSHLLPRMYLGSDAADIQFASEIAFPTGNKLVDALAQRVQGAGLALRVLHLEQGTLPATMLACVTDSDAHPPQSHIGFGTSLSPSHAMTRAVTECIQSRVVDIQAAREDILRLGEPEGVMGAHARRQDALPHGRWYFDLPAPLVDLCSIPDQLTDDLAIDLRLLIDSLEEMGASAVSVVDLSPADLAVHVVRVIVPEIETTLVNGRIGRKVVDELNPFRVRAVTQSGERPQARTKMAPYVPRRHA